MNRHVIATLVGLGMLAAAGRASAQTGPGIGPGVGVLYAPWGYPGTYGPGFGPLSGYGYVPYYGNLGYGAPLVSDPWRVRYPMYVRPPVVSSRPVRVMGPPQARTYPYRQRGYYPAAQR